MTHRTLRRILAGALSQPVTGWIPGCHSLSQAVTSWPRLSRLAQAVTGCHRLSQAAMGCHRLAQALPGCHRLPWVVTGWPTLSQAVPGCLAGCWQLSIQQASQRLPLEAPWKL